MNSSYQKAVNQIQEVPLMADFRYSLAGKKDADVLAEASAPMQWEISSEMAELGLLLPS